MQKCSRAGSFTAMLIIGALFAAACGSSKNNSSTTTAKAPVKEGGDVVFGAEQEPDCTDWIASCAGASWGVYTMQAHTMPRTYNYDDAKGHVFNSDLLVSEPVLTASPQTVTYKINPKAVWSDGQPITSADFQYTWDAIANGKDIYDQTGYSDITGVDTPDPQTAVVHFKDPYADWQDLFGGFYGIYPSHLLKGKDHEALMKTGYKWSGGPWMIDHWTKGQEVQLVPNPMWYGATKAHFHSVTFKFITDTAAEISAYKTSQVSAIYPQASLDLPVLKTQPNTNFDVVTSLSYEALWFNADKLPKSVRQALGYAIDRAAIVQQLFAPVQPDIKPINSFNTPANAKWYTDAFSIYTVDKAKVDSTLTADGYAKGSDGIYAKGGKALSVEVRTTAGNKRRELTEQLLQSQLKDAGIGMTINNEKAGTLFGQDLPKGNFQAAIYAQVPSSDDPGLCLLFCSKNIPSAANGNNGQNWDRVTDPAIDTPWLAADQELDPTARKADVTSGEVALAANPPGIPIDPFPDVVVWNTSALVGPIGHNFVFGPWVNMNDWSIA